MIRQEEVENRIAKIKSAIKSEYDDRNYNECLDLIALAARILYQTNIYYADKYLEDYLKKISSEISLKTDAFLPNDNVLLYWDGFGLNSRGLVQIYMKALGKFKKVIYVTYEDRKKDIPDVMKIVSSNGGECFFVKRDSTIRTIEQLNNIVIKHCPKHFFFYSVPDDVVATTLMYSYENKLIRYQINLTDHAFWLGAYCIDKCLEFRDYGASISLEYREIPKEKLVYMPYYPNCDESIKFDGYPFEFDSKKQKLIFSGGALYKTIDESGYYYEIVDYILSKYSDAVFWYAGTGDSSKMDKIISKYPGRAYLTGERKDFFRVIEKSVFYLNTYPLLGGLMTQYAAIAGKIPLTLVHNRDNSGILINQDSLGIEFTKIDDIKREIDILMTDNEYLKMKSSNMRGAIITEERFNQEIKNILTDGNTTLKLNLKYEDTVEFRNEYLHRISSIDLDRLYNPRKSIIRKHFPCNVLRGGDVFSNRKNKDTYEVSVICGQYNTSWNRLEKTLDSIIKQEKVNFQIVVSDDGSEYNWFKEIEEYFARRNFHDFILLPSKSNQGIVQNVIKGVSAAAGEYIKLISPGDYLYGNMILRKWIDDLKLSGKRWSFGDAIYYIPGDDKKMNITVENAHPQDVKPYLDNDDEKCRWNYVALGDITLGATILSERNLTIEYLNKINGRIKFAEDNIYRLMMFMGDVPKYYPANVIWYEYGTGVSTSKNSAWSIILRNDWKCANEIMEEIHISNDKFQKEMLLALEIDKYENKLTKLIKMPRKYLFIRHKLKMRYMRRKTCDSI